MEIRDVSYCYGNHQVLDQINLEIGKKDFFALFGEDDAGKTTLLRLMMGLDMHYEGEIVWNDDSNGKQMSLQNIRFLPDDIIREKSLTVRQYMNFARGAAIEYDLDLQEQLCQKFEIPLNVQLLNLTYRENKMVQIIAALSAKPDFIILDEPVNFLDMQTYRSVLELLLQKNQEGVGILTAVEKYSDIYGYCNRYAYLKEGKIVASGNVPVPDQRKKIITVTGGKKERLDDLMDQLISQQDNKGVYLYQREMKMLPSILAEVECEDFIVEDMTLEEELEMDFSRWE